jgi:TRAP-type C4-dicarboxylate transport system permease small subunit
MTSPEPATAPAPARAGAFQRISNLAMGGCLAVMATAVFINVVLRYGFGSGIAASEELSRLLFVWMVFIGATAAYPLGEHMAFTSLVCLLRKNATAFMVMAMLIRGLVILACALLAWGAWQQVVVGLGSRSVVLGYPTALLPLPAMLSATAIGLMALVELIKNQPLDLGHGAEVE